MHIGHEMWPFKRFVKFTEVLQWIHVNMCEYMYQQKCLPSWVSRSVVNLSWWRFAVFIFLEVVINKTDILTGVLQSLVHDGGFLVVGLTEDSCLQHDDVSTFEMWLKTLSNYKALTKQKTALLLWINNSEHLTKSKHCLVKSVTTNERR